MKSFRRWMAGKPAGLMSFVLFLLGGTLMSGKPDALGARLPEYNLFGFGLWLALAAIILHLESMDNAVSLMLQDTDDKTGGGE